MCVPGCVLPSPFPHHGPCLLLEVLDDVLRDGPGLAGISQPPLPRRTNERHTCNSFWMACCLCCAVSGVCCVVGRVVLLELLQPVLSLFPVWVVQQLPNRLRHHTLNTARTNCVSLCVCVCIPLRPLRCPPATGAHPQPHHTHPDDVCRQTPCRPYHLNPTLQHSASSSTHHQHHQLLLPRWVCPAECLGVCASGWRRASGRLPP